MKLRYYLLAAVALLLATFAGVYLLQNHPGGDRSGVLTTVAWQRMASPGALSPSHASLEHNCAACHTPAAGVEAASCIVCHADNQSLLQRQPTAFHADVRSCVECHGEHEGAGRRPAQMDHVAFAKLSLRDIGGDSKANAARDGLVKWIRHFDRDFPGTGRTRISSEEAALNCAACHANQDRHRGFFGSDCAQCHATTAWKIPEYRHPPPTSTSCVQCHQAPPSHYMMHFQMISMKVAGREHAQVSQCYLCHQTTSWNDIKGVGWYKHH